VTFVVYGKRNTKTIALSRLGSHGYKIGGKRAGDSIGFDVSGGRDLNGDSVPDHLITGLGRRGAMSYMVWGRRSGT
jgi:hypothetical protein